MKFFTPRHPVLPNLKKILKPTIASRSIERASIYVMQKRKIFKRCTRESKAKTRSHFHTSIARVCESRLACQQFILLFIRRHSSTNKKWLSISSRQEPIKNYLPYSQRYVTSPDGIITLRIQTSLSPAPPVG